VIIPAVCKLFVLLDCFSWNPTIQSAPWWTLTPKRPS
jgi:hypothetical protein